VILLKSQAELDTMRAAGKVVAGALAGLRDMAKAGVTTKELDAFAEDYIVKAGATPAFKGYMGYPATICASINEVVVHGIPSARKLKDGDIIGIDMGAVVDGFYGDAATTIMIGEVAEEVQKLVRVTEECLLLGIEKAVVGNRISDISHAVQTHAEANGFSVVREFVGHGVGRKLHEEPQVPNFGEPGKGSLLKPGMTIAIEPMVNLGKSRTVVLGDGWTAVTIDRKPSAHFEHTIAVTEAGPLILTRAGD